jgi:hypothetical protein
VVFDTSGGTLAAMADVCADPDDIFADAWRRRFYLTRGAACCRPSGAASA